MQNHRPRGQRPAPRHVALSFPQGLSFVERILHGVTDYARERGPWSFIRMPEMLTPSIDWLVGSPADGALALITNPADMQIARSLPFPVVNLAAHLDPAGITSVTVDHRKIGALAAAHLLGLGFTRFGFYGTRDRWYSQQRFAGFSGAIRAANGTCRALFDSVRVRKSKRWRDQQRIVMEWLRQMEPPVGILASTDLRACTVLDAAVEIGWKVPTDVAIIGVDNDPVVCELSNPPLSSIDRNDRLVGREAAALLDRLMSGAPAPRQPVFIAPEQVVQRKSTDTIAVDDALLARAIATVNEHLHESFGVERLVRQSGLGRRRLEQRFRHALGCTPYAFISQQRVSRAKQLLAGERAVTLTQVAHECGFADLRRFRLVFRRLTGLSPREFRARAQKSG